MTSADDPDGRSEEQTLGNFLDALERFVARVEPELMPTDRQDAVRRLDALIEKLLP